MALILVVEQEKASGERLRAVLEHHGFCVETAAGEEITAARLKDCPCSLALCRMPAEKAEGLRALLLGRDLPVLWLAEQDELPRLLQGFCMGREDYVVQPVSPAELLLRIYMLLRCAGVDDEKRLRAGSLLMDADARLAQVDGREVPLTKREFDILFGLLTAPGRVFTRRELLSRYWDAESAAAPRAVDGCVHNEAAGEVFGLQGFPDCHSTRRRVQGGSSVT